MKLIKRTYLMTGMWLLPVMVIGSIFCFLMIEYIAYEETDEFLTYEMGRLVNYHREFNDLPEFHQVARIIPDTRFEKPFFKDTLILEPADNELVPYRELHFSINHKGRDFGIVLQHLLLGRDDIAQGTIMIILGLMLLTALFVILILNQVTGKIWKPFYQTLGKLVKFKIDRPLPEFPETNIDEFRSLNDTLDMLLKKIVKDYRNNREYHENVSHELQTHLAVIRANTEILLGDDAGKPQRLKELKKIYSATTRLSQAQKSLLLISRISNQEFSNHAAVDMQKVVAQVLDTYIDAINVREIVIQRDTREAIVFMDPGLAEILVSNLFKNAVKHNIHQGYITIRLDSSSLTVANSGQPFQGDPASMLERFTMGNGGNSGLGLAIARQICDLYGFSIAYRVEGESDHIVTVRFENSERNTDSLQF